ncbi:MAG: FAD-dependent oxidoreductase [Acidobacteria bacterium]|nr:FAD-dependent oxidoreductase [Acidobacteriota bacterium]
MGAEVTILYRRTREEMPAIGREIEEALEEGIKIEYLAAPLKIVRRDDGKISKILVQRMSLGEPDASGRRRPIAVEGDTYEIEADAIIMAVSQAPDWTALGGSIETKGSWLEVDEWGRTGTDGVFSGGDTLTLGLATISIGQGRRAAEAIHARLRSMEPKHPAKKPEIPHTKLKMDFYEPAERAKRTVKTPAERLAAPLAESDLGITAEQTLAEVSRCFSCGLCMGCERCWMYCQVSCFKKEKTVGPGHYFKLDIGNCDGCKKCAEECPCGYIDLN